MRDRYRILYPTRRYARARATAEFGRVECEAALGRLAAYHESRYLEPQQGLVAVKR